MHEIVIKETEGVYVEFIDLLTTHTPFYHVDRIAKYDVLIYVISGYIYVTEEEMNYEIGPGQMILLKQGTHQYGKKLIAAGTSWIFAHFYHGEINNAELNTMGRDDQPSEIVLPKTVGNLSKTDIPQRLKQLIKLSDTNKTLSKNRVSSAFHTLLLDIYEQDNPLAPSDLSGQIAKYLQHRVRETLTGEEIAQQFHLTYKHLTRTFSGVYGVGIMQYHIQLKMQVAARELRSSDKSISHIAMDLGFSDPLYFSKCFRKQFGISPRNYRHNQVLKVFSN